MQKTEVLRPGLSKEHMQSFKSKFNSVFLEIKSNLDICEYPHFMHEGLIIFFKCSATPVGAAGLTGTYATQATLRLQYTV